eukprot:scaffold42286_cov51-Attheya_sp.AAC.5
MHRCSSLYSGVGGVLLHGPGKRPALARLSRHVFSTRPRDSAQRLLQRRQRVFNYRALSTYANKPLAKQGEDDVDTKTSEKPSNDSLYRLVELSRREWKLIGLSAGTLGLTSSITLLLPYASGHVIDYTMASNTDGALSPMILAGGLFGLSAVAGGGVYLRSLWLARAGNRIVARLKQRLYGSILQQDSAFLDKQTTGDLLSRLSADTQMIQSAVTSHAVSGLRGMVMTIGSASMLMYTSPTLAFVSCCTLPPIFILTRHVGRSLKKQQEAVQRLQGDAASLAEQSISNIQTVKQFVGEEYETVRYSNAIAKAHATAVETAHKQAQLEAGAHVAGNGAVLCVLGYGGSLVLAGEISSGDLTGFVMYSLLMAGNLSGLTSLYGDLVRAVAASNRVFAILDRPVLKTQAKLDSTLASSNSSIVDPKADPLLPIHYKHPVYSGTTRIRPAPVSIDIQNLNFRYPSRPDVPVLHDFNLSIAPGEVVGLVGSSGSGKSTIAGLLTCMYNADKEDSILINDRPVGSYDLHELRRLIGVVSQEPALFRGSIRDNIVYGQWDNVTEEQIEEAARSAHVLDFSEKFPDGMDTMVGPRGMQLSGGQRQRIALARVMLKDPPLVILDEATSALDAQSEHLVQQAMNSIFNKSERTVISIAHRLSTIRHTDRIAVVDHGRIVQTGPFEELSATPGPFRDLMKTQLL